MVSFFLFVFFLLSHLPPLHSTEEEMRYAQKCPPISCGSVGMIGFPFTNTSHPECGPFTVECHSFAPWIRFGEGRRSYKVLEIVGNNVLLIHDDKFPTILEYPRCEFSTNLAVPSSSFFSVKIPLPSSQTFYKCNSTYNVHPPPDVKTISCGDANIYYNPVDDFFPPNFSRCSTIQLSKYLNLGPNRLPNGDDLFSIVTPEFVLEVHVHPECLKCYEKGSQCKARTNGKFYCKKGLNKNQKIGIGIALVGVGIGVMLVAICCLRKKFLSNNTIYLWKRKSLTYQTVQAFLKDHGHLAIKQYNYSDIKKITNSFNNKLGEGGYGSVYKGKLQDGCLVAVKVLKESKSNGEEFINEVASISRTSHVNIVSLMGFCFEHSKRALIYEFMPNGSLEKFIYKTNASSDLLSLEWETIYKIALGIAQGLEYLHKGCNTRILHFDIKPHNILLDEYFSPKISDFGLAKICQREQSIVSMLGARGTIGYIAPEVFCRSIGGISHKSDVYSYGMLVLEMIGGRRNIEVDVDHTSEIFFPHWIHKRIERDDHLGLQNLMNENDQETTRKMTIVGLWCIQTNPSNRPSMDRVVNMLEGLEPLQVPPKPILSSPSRLLENSLTTTESLQ